MQADILQSIAFTWVFKLYLTDHITPATGKTVAVTLWKFGDGAAFSNPSVGASNATEIANGWYKFTSSTTDTGALGPIIWLGTCTGCDNADQSYQVIKATNGGMTGIPDAAAGANGGLPILSSSATTLAYTVSTVTTTTTATNLTNLPSIPANWLTATGIAASALNGKGDWTTTASTIARVTLVDTLTTYTGNTPQTGDSFARIGATGSGLTSLAPSATALSTVTWTGTLATNLTTLASHDPGTTIGTSTYAGADTSGTTTLLARLTSTRAGYLDNLSGGAVALASGVVLTSAGLDAVVVEIGLNARQALSIVASACGGVGGDTSGFYEGAGVATHRITYTAAAGERTAVVLNPPA